MNRLSIALLALLVCAPIALADDEPPPQRQPPTETASNLITIDLNEVPLVMALQGIGRMAGLNVVVDAAVVSDPATRDVDVTIRRIDESARKILREVARSNGLRIDEQANGVILIRPGAKASKGNDVVVVQIHAVSDICKSEEDVVKLGETVGKHFPSARAVAQGRASLIIYATRAEHDKIDRMLSSLRQLHAKPDPTQVKLRFFDVKDLIHKFHKLPARMKRLFPALQAVEQKNGILIVRGTNAELDRVGADLDELRKTLRPGVPLLDGVPLVGRERTEQEDREQVRRDREQWQREYEAKRERFVRDRATLQALEALHVEIRALRDEVRQLRALLEERK